MYKQKMNKELKEYLYMLVGSILTLDDYRKILDYFNQLKQERDHYKNKTLDNLYMKDFGGEKVFCLEDDKETYRDMIFELQERIDKALFNIQRIIAYGFDYDGFNSVENLKGLIDMLVDYAEKAKDILKGSDEDEKEV